MQYLPLTQAIDPTPASHRLPSFPLDAFLCRDLTRICMSYLPDAAAIWKAANQWQEALLLVNSFSAEKLEKRIKAKNLSEEEQNTVWQKLYYILQGEEALWDCREIGKLGNPVQTLELMPEKQICCLEDSLDNPSNVWIFNYEQANSKSKVQNKLWHKTIHKSGKVFATGKSLYLKQFDAVKRRDLFFKLMTDKQILTTFSDGTIAISGRLDSYRIYIIDPRLGHEIRNELLGTPGLFCRKLKELPKGGILGSFVQEDDSQPPLYLFWETTHSQPKKFPLLKEDHFDVLSDERILVTGRDHGLKISYTPLGNFESYIVAPFTDVLHHPIHYVPINDGGFVSSCGDGSINLYRYKLISPVVLKNRSSHATALLNLKDGRFASGHDDGSVCVWEPNVTKALEQVLPTEEQSKEVEEEESLQETIAKTIRSVMQCLVGSCRNG